MSDRTTKQPTEIPNLGQIYAGHLDEFGPKLREHIRKKVVEIGEEHFFERLQTRGSPLTALIFIKNKTKKGIDHAFSLWLEWEKETPESTDNGYDVDQIISEYNHPQIARLQMLESKLRIHHPNWNDQTDRNTMYSILSDIINALEEHYDAEAYWEDLGGTIIDGGDTYFPSMHDPYLFMLHEYLQQVFESIVVWLELMQNSEEHVWKICDWEKEKESFTSLLPTLTKYQENIESWKMLEEFEYERLQMLKSMFSHILDTWNIVQVQMRKET